MSTMADTKTKRTRRSFTEDFKAGAVRLVLDEGQTVGAVGARLWILTESSLRELGRARAGGSDQGQDRPDDARSARSSCGSGKNCGSSRRSAKS